MKRIILISCSSKKSNRASKAKDMYISTLFKSSLAYAKNINPDKIYILSALYGLVDLEQEIAPYNFTLKTLNANEKIIWGKQIIEQLKKVVDIEKDLFICLAGEIYINPISQSIKNLEIPLKGLRIGERINFLIKNN